MSVDTALGGETRCAGTTGGESFPFDSASPGTMYYQLHMRVRQVTRRTGFLHIRQKWTCYTGVKPFCVPLRPIFG